MKLPQVVLSYTHSISEEIFADFLRLVSPAGLDIQVESREADGPYAGLEWLMPTAVIIFIGKSYFDSFFSEMGKDHYSMLKAGLKSLRAKLFGSKTPKVVKLGTQGKLAVNQSYSFVFSIIAEAEPGLRFKLLLQSEPSEEEYEEIINAFFNFLAEYHSGNLAIATVDMLQKCRVVGGTLLISFNLTSKAIEAIDPVPVKK